MPKPDMDEIISDILNHPAPVIFLDTCIILDIIRALYREKIDIKIVVSAKELIIRSQAEPAGIWLLISEIVETEWNNNINSVVKELRSEIKKLRKNLFRLERILENLFSGTPIPYPDIASYDLDVSLRNISEKLLKSSISFSNDMGCFAKSSLRVIRNEAPASKGKSEAKDCMIIEHYLKISRCLHENGFKEKRIFITSNKKDYGKPSDIRQPLKNEFENVGLAYVDNLAWAVSMI
ncbi:MAG: hypothetical protein B6245_14110 [Desulfobacteraceae bacterium 4572_88]|nr:MAG: hypothetical protein B6245_14110 [Desulfobacteraceae bacterium 4572_88]